VTARGGYADLFTQDRTAPHWAYDYAARLAARHRHGHRILIQTSMSPTGPFHIGNLRDTVCAHLVHRALVRSGRRSAILLSFDDFDPFRPRQAAADPVLARYGSRPLAVARERSTAICRAYLRELKDLGICPPEADADGRTPAGSAWLTHYQWERYTGGEYRHIQRRYIRRAARLATILGVSGPRKLFAVYCQQCGRNTTVLHELHPGRVRYDCRSCGACVTTGAMECVKPAWAVDWTLRVTHEHIDCEPAGQDHCSAGSTMDRTRAVYHRFLGTRQPVIVPYGLVRQSGQRHKISGSRAGGLLPRDLLRALPPVLILWLYARPNCRSDMRVGLDRAALLAAYDGWDRFVAGLPASVRGRALWALLTDDPPPAGPPLPRMRTVLGRLHTACYDAELVTRELAAGRDRAAVAERVGHALAWLSGPGRDTSWLLRADPDPPGADPLRDGGLGGNWDRARHAALLRALFAVPDGPPLRRLLAQFGADALVAAGGAHARTGRRPLRDLALARLDEAGARRAG
jgi:lysyl-tRNA synthetase class I